MNRRRSTMGGICPASVAADADSVWEVGRLEQRVRLQALVDRCCSARPCRDRRAPDRFVDQATACLAGPTGTGRVDQPVTHCTAVRPACRPRSPHGLACRHRAAPGPSAVASGMPQSCRATIQQGAFFAKISPQGGPGDTLDLALLRDPGGASTRIPERRQDLQACIDSACRTDPGRRHQALIGTTRKQLWALTPGASGAFL